MTREQLTDITNHVTEIMNNAWRTLTTTSIPDWYIIDYIKKETGIDVSKVKCPNTITTD